MALFKYAPKGTIVSASTSSIIRALALSAPFLLMQTPAKAERFTTGTVMQKMGSEERFAFVAGIVEGLAMSRYMQDGKKPEGMKCIYDWFYVNPKTVENIYAAFERYPDYPPGTVVDVRARKTCS